MEEEPEVVELTAIGVGRGTPFNTINLRKSSTKKNKFTDEILTECDTYYERLSTRPASCLSYFDSCAKKARNCLSLLDSKLVDKIVIQYAL